MFLVLRPFDCEKIAQISMYPRVQVNKYLYSMTIDCCYYYYYVLLSSMRKLFVYYRVFIICQVFSDSLAASEKRKHDCVNITVDVDTLL